MASIFDNIKKFIGLWDNSADTVVPQEKQVDQNQPSFFEWVADAVSNVGKFVSNPVWTTAWFLLDKWVDLVKDNTQIDENIWWLVDWIKSIPQDIINWEYNNGDFFQWVKKAADFIYNPVWAISSINNTNPSFLDLGSKVIWTALDMWADKLAWFANDMNESTYREYVRNPEFINNPLTPVYANFLEFKPFWYEIGKSIASNLDWITNDNQSDVSKQEQFFINSALNRWVDEFEINKSWNIQWLDLYNKRFFKLWENQIVEVWDKTQAEKDLYDMVEKTNWIIDRSPLVKNADRNWIWDFQKEWIQLLGKYWKTTLEDMIIDQSIKDWISVIDIETFWADEINKVKSDMITDVSKFVWKPVDFETAQTIANTFASLWEKSDQVTLEFKSRFKNEDQERLKKYYPEDFEKRINEIKIKNEEVANLEKDVTWLLSTEAKELSNKLLVEKDWGKRALMKNNFLQLQDQISSNTQWSSEFVQVVSDLTKWDIRYNQFNEDLKRSVDLYDKNFTNFAKLKYNNFFWWLNNIDSERLAEKKYALEIWDEWAIVEWKRLTKEEIRSTVDWWNVWDISRIVAYHITAPLSKVKDIDWKEKDIALQRYMIWKNKFNPVWMEWINYMNAQIKDIVLANTKSAYVSMWYRLWWIVSNAFSVIWQAWENILSNPIRNAQELTLNINNKTALSFIWETNNLQFNEDWTSFSEFLNTSANFIDEYWEVAPDLILSITPAWFYKAPIVLARAAKATRIWEAFSKWASLLNNWSKLINYWENINDLRLIGIWKKMVDLSVKWNKMVDDAVDLYKSVDVLWFVNKWNLASAGNLSKEWAIDVINAGNKRLIWTQQLKSTFWELVENVVQDRVVWSLIFNKTNTTYEDDVKIDNLITFWMFLPFWILKWWTKRTTWFTTQRKVLDSLRDVMTWNAASDNLVRIATRSALDTEILKAKEWVDYAVNSEWIIYWLSANWQKKVNDAQSIGQVFVNQTNKAIIATWWDVSQFSKIVAIRRLQDIWVQRRKRWEPIEDIFQEINQLVKWWSSTDVFAKEFAIKEWENTAVVAWDWATVLLGKNEMIQQTKVKDLLWFTPSELEAWIPESVLTQRISEKWVDVWVKDLFTKIESDSWEPIYKYWWENSIEIASNKIANKEWEMQDIINRLPEEQQKLVSISESILNDLSANIICDE